MSEYTLSASFVKDTNEVSIDGAVKVPDADYIGMFVGVKPKEIKPLNATGLEYQFLIQEGQCKGIKLDMFITLECDNEDMLRMGKINLKKAFIATGHKEVSSDARSILNKQVRIKSTQKTDKNGNIRSNISNIYPELMPSGRTAASAAAQPEPAAAASAPQEASNKYDFLAD